MTTWNRTTMFSKRLCWKEAEAFLKKEFIRMHSSTISKVEFFRHVISLAIQRKLRTAGNGFLVRVDRLLDGRAARAIAFIAARRPLPLPCSSRSVSEPSALA